MEEALMIFVSTLSAAERQALKTMMRQAAGEIEDPLKDQRKAFLEHALQGTWAMRNTRLPGAGSGNSRNGSTRENHSHGRGRNHHPDAARRSGLSLVLFGFRAHPSEMDDADQELESRPATVCHLVF
jgi:hypothetical protein